MLPFCPLCFNHAEGTLNKRGVLYQICSSCKSVYSDPLDQENKVGGEHEEGRNQVQNQERVGRVDFLVKDLKKTNVKILDFGCGHGLLVSDLKKASYYADGFDPYNEEFSLQPLSAIYDVVSVIEVIEHTSHPFYEILALNRYLKLYGIAMIETSFVNVAWEDKIPLEDFFYINPSVGHATIFSHHGLDVLMCRHGFIPVDHFNRHVRCFKKVAHYG